jgi:hypothetical protein
VYRSLQWHQLYCGSQRDKGHKMKALAWIVGIFVVLEIVPRAIQSGLENKRKKLLGKGLQK